MTLEKRVNILLVDDQPGKLLTHEAVLAELNENLIKASSARDALEHLLRTDIAVVLIDVCMPELDGFELAALIRDHPRCRKTAIIFVSAVLMTDLDRIRGYGMGAVDYVTVPVLPDVLRAKVSIFVDLYRKTEALEELNQELETRVKERTADLEAANARLRENETRKDEFLAMLAHELRNPLAPIRNSVAVMAQGPLAQKDFEWCRNVIDRQVGHLTRLVDDLLDVSRISRNRIELSRSEVDLSEVIEAAEETVRPMILQNDQRFFLTPIPEPIVLHADRVRLTQCVSNLLHNAAKFTPRAGTIRVTAEQVFKPSDNHEPFSEVLLKIEDTGIGIHPDQLSRVFDMFYQADTSMNRSQGGLGIGLTLVRRLVELHGGTVDAYSRGVGEGSEFVVRLPASARGTVPARAPAEEVRTAPSRRVLVVDDNQDAAESLGLLLSLGGNEVRVTNDARKALEIAEDFRPAVAFLDLGMPIMTGYDLALRIRKLSWGERVVLVALTGWGQEEDRRRTKDAGFDVHLVKPVDRAALLRVVSATRQELG